MKHLIEGCQHRYAFWHSIISTFLFIGPIIVGLITRHYLLCTIGPVMWVLSGWHFTRKLDQWFPLTHK
jgi:hypothetical protein